MALQLGSFPNLFPHSRIYEQGSGNVRKGQSTYIVAKDGSGDFSSIDEAIKAARQGGTIYIKEGTYTEKNLSLTTNNITLQGTGKNTIVQLHSTLSGTLLAITAKGIVIDGIYFIKGSSSASLAINVNNGYSFEAIIKNCWFDTITTGIKIVDSWGVIVQNCIFASGTMTTGIQITNTTGNLCGSHSINSCVFRDFNGASDIAIHLLRGSADPLDTVAVNSIVGNIILEGGSVVITVTNSGNNVFLGNAFANGTLKINSGTNNIIVGNTATVSDSGTTTELWGNQIY